MTKSQIREVAWLSDEYVHGPIRALILSFHGLGGGIRTAPTTQNLAWAHAGGLVLFPYYGPWSWMNRQARAFVDGLIDEVRAEFNVPAAAPLISTGGSMGGQGTLIFTRYSRHKIARCQAMNPVCDLAYHRTERPDLPPTIAHAYRGYPEDFDAVIKEHSPIEQAAQLPRIPYMIVHGERDQSVNKQKHSDRMAAAMKSHGHDVTYIQDPDMAHGGPMSLDTLQKEINFVLQGFVEA